MRKSLVAAVLLGLPFVAVAAVPRFALGPVAIAAARRMAHLGAALERHRVLADADPPNQADDSAPPPAEAPTTSEAAKRASARGARPHAPAHGIFVARSVVERAIRTRARPSGHPVGASDAHPAGVAVSHGAGPLRAGDVITEVDGRPVRSVEDVIVAVGGAARAKAKAISGRFWRGGEPWTITVETPW